MVFKLAVATVAVAALVGAANYKRVACPDGKNTASHEAVRPIFPAFAGNVSDVFFLVLRVLRAPR